MSSLDQLDGLIASNYRKIQKQTQTDFWDRNKKLFVLLIVVLGVLSFFCAIYFVYGIRKIYLFTNSH